MRRWCIRKIFKFLILLHLVHGIANGEPISVGIAVGTAFTISAGLSGYGYFKCKFYECCDADWVHLNVTGLKNELNKRLYGQPLVISTTLRALKAHFNNEKTSKALVLSFHGWTGNGKNFVADIIAGNIYRRGKGSNYVKLFLPKLHFSTGNGMEISQLQATIKSQVKSCARSLFLFDEVDKINVEVINAIKPFIDYHEKVDGVDYRKSIFIFMSNTGGNDITEKTFEYWRRGIGRQDMQLAELENLIITAAYNEDGGLRYSDLIKNNLIDHFIPFLPLERIHVKLCIKDYFSLKKLKIEDEDEFLSKVADSLQFFPKGVEVYSTSGCKRVQQKVDLYVEEQFELFEKALQPVHARDDEF